MPLKKTQKYRFVVRTLVRIKALTTNSFFEKR